MTLEKSIFAILLTVVLIFAAITWQESRNDRARLESTIAAQQQIINAAESREKDRDATLKTTLAQIAATKQSTQTPEQILRALPQFLHLPDPITLSPHSSAAIKPGKGSAPLGNDVQFPGTASESDIPDSNLKSETLDLLPVGPFPATISKSSDASSSAPAGTNLSQAPPLQSATIPASDLKPLFDYIQDCRACEAQLRTAQADLTDEKASKSALARERDAAITANKGGTLWHRLKHNAKWLAAGAALTAALTHLR
jgi:hypothetical protein